HISIFPSRRTTSRTNNMPADWILRGEPDQRGGISPPGGCVGPEGMKARVKPASLGHPESSARNLDPAARKEIDRRLARIEGHVAAIRRMMSAGEDCDSLLVQASAVRSALNGVLVSLMEAHLDSCVIPCSKTGKNEMAIDRFRQALETVLKRS